MTGDEVLTLFARYKVRSFQLFECMDKGLQAYWLDKGKLKKIVDGRLIARKYNVLDREYKVIKKENDHLPNVELRRMVINHCKESFPDLPWNKNNYYPMSLRFTGDEHKDYRLMRKAMDFFLFKESDVHKFKEKEFSNPERDFNEKSNDFVKNKTGHTLYKRDYDNKDKHHKLTSELTQTKKPGHSETQSLDDTIREYKPEIETLYKELIIIIERRFKMKNAPKHTDKGIMEEAFNYLKEDGELQYMTLNQALQGCPPGSNPSKEIKMPILRAMICDFNRIVYRANLQICGSNEKLYQLYNSV